MSTFKLIQKIGEGSYSRVYKAINESTGKILAVKIISFKNAPFEYINSREIKLLRECQHPNIAPILDCIVTEESVYLVFQFFPMNLNQFYKYYRNLYDKNLDEILITRIMAQICSALSYLHSKSIMHRDVKPENIMINPLTMQIKLIDFGFAKQNIKDQNTEYMVTRWYRPLQIVIGLSYDQKIDVFAAAAIYLELVQGFEIFQSDSNNQQLHLLLKILGYPESGTRQFIALEKLNIINSYDTPTLSEYTMGIKDQIKEVLSSMLDNCSEKRPGIDKLWYAMMRNSSPIPQAPRILRVNSCNSTRKRGRSLATGLTLVSMTHMSKQKDERQSRPQIKENNPSNFCMMQ